MKQNWYSNELPKDQAEVFKEYLRERNIYFEPSSALNLIHFEMFMTEEEMEKANKFLHNLNIH